MRVSRNIGNKKKKFPTLKIELDGIDYGLVGLLRKLKVLNVGRK